MALPASSTARAADCLAVESAFGRQGSSDFLGELMSRRRFACGANQPIRLFQNVGIFGLFSRKKADHHERRAK
jgi:hypothetical protein